MIDDSFIHFMIPNPSLEYLITGLIFYSTAISMWYIIKLLFYHAFQWQVSIWSDDCETEAPLVHLNFSCVIHYLGPLKVDFFIIEKSSVAFKISNFLMILSSLGKCFMKWIHGRSLSILKLFCSFLVWNSWRECFTVHMEFDLPLRFSWPREVKKPFKSYTCIAIERVLW